MSGQAIRAPSLFDGTSLHADKAVLIEDGWITAILPSSDIPSDFPIFGPKRGTFLAPGLIDLQVNGGGGVLFNDALHLDGLRQIAAAHRALGTAHLLPTLISGNSRQIAAALDAVRAAIAIGLPGILGLHIEGPFLNAHRRGIHPHDAIRPLSAVDLALLTTPFPGPLMVTLAPEMVPEDMLRLLAQAGVILFAGHTEATPDELVRARAAGLVGFTHLFNAMPPLAARSPGPVGAALADGASFASLIVDGLHVHAASLAAAIAAKGADRLCLVSDAMPTVGAATTSFRFGEANITLADGRLTDASGTLAGAHLSLGAAVHNAHRLLGMAPADVLRMATSTPAACLGIGDRLGALRPGVRADLALFDSSLALLGTWTGGVFAPAEFASPPP